MSDITRFGDQIQFEDMHEDTEYGETTIYFNAPVDILHGEYPDAEGATISVAFPTKHEEYKLSQTKCSPTRDGFNYYWFNVDISGSDFDFLINKWLDNRSLWEV